MNDSQTSSAGPPTRTHSFLIGPHGLRAGWACFLFIFLFFLFGQTVNVVLQKLLHGRPRPSVLTPGFAFVLELVEVLAVIFITFVMARGERRSFGSFGLRDLAFLPRFGTGLLAGFAAITALIWMLWSLHLAALSGPTLAASALLRYGLVWGVVFLLTGVFEEMLLRGYLLFTLRRGIGFWWSALLLSAAFGLIHGTNLGETPVGLFSAAAVGLLFCLSIFYTGSLWWAIGFHAAWDWGETFFWGTSDSGMAAQGHLMNEHPLGARLWSGGATGPEGSLLVFPVLLLCALGMFWWWGMRKSPRHAQS